MGQDCSWPCANKRKEQEKRLIQSKYTNAALEEVISQDEFDDFRKTERLHNLEKIQEIIERKSYNKNPESTATELKYKSSQPQSPTGSSGTGTQSAFTFTEDSVVVDSELSILFLLEEINSFDKFLSQIVEKHGNMSPMLVIPHPSKHKTVVILQTNNLISNINADKEQKFFDFEKDLRKENNNNAYQIIVSFLKQQHDEGFEYIGYYFDQKGIYHFIFTRKTLKPVETHLDFLTISGMSESEIQSTLSRAIREHYKLRGMIALQPTSESSNALSFLILEKKKTNIEQYITVRITGDTFQHDGPNIDFSKKIEHGCRSDKLDVAGLIVLHESDSYYLVFSERPDL